MHHLLGSAVRSRNFVTSRPPLLTSSREKSVQDVDRLAVHAFRCQHGTAPPVGHFDHQTRRRLSWRQESGTVCHLLSRRLLRSLPVFKRRWRPALHTLVAFTCRWILNKHKSRQTCAPINFILFCHVYDLEIPLNYVSSMSLVYSNNNNINNNIIIIIIMGLHLALGYWSRQRCNQPLWNRAYRLGQNLTPVDSYPYLGVSILFALRWSTDINNICAMITRTLNFIRRHI